MHVFSNERKLYCIAGLAKFRIGVTKFGNGHQHNKLQLLSSVKRQLCVGMFTGLGDCMGHGCYLDFD